MASETLDASEAPPIGTKLGGAYELIRFLGAGGMGAVYEAVGPDGARVAVKVLLQTALHAEGGKMVARFEREAKLTADLDSPHIVPTLDAGVDQALAIPYMVMSLLVGQDLDDLIERVGPLQPVVAARIFRQACAGLATAHAAGVIHRDIKPGNIFLHQDPTGGVTVRLLDFGIAKWRGQDSALTRTGTMLGTPHYMSPEQCQDFKNAGPRSDVWSLAISLYQALGGQLPFEDVETLGKLYVAIMTRDVPPLQDVAAWVPPGLAAVVHGALLLDRERRCPDAEQLGEALRPFTAGLDELNAGMLEPLTIEAMAHRAARAKLPTSWGLTGMPAPSASATQLSESSDPLLGYDIDGRYRLLRCLGKGGMGAVYEAQAAGGDRCAVKVIDPAAAGKRDAVHRFVREARAVMKIDSANVVRVIEADVVGEQELHYIVMELLHGSDMGALIERRGALQPGAVARLFTQACRGLHAAHEQGFVHRDIKPANLFLNELPSGEVVVKICDFGIVKQVVTDDEHTTVALTHTGGVIGSPLFMSPEQAKNARDIDLRTDVWSLGVAMFQALTGAHPWQGHDTVGELIVAICTAELPHLQDLAPWVPAELAEVVHRAMSRPRADRFQSMAALEQALAPFTGDAVEVRSADLAPVPQRLRSHVAVRSAERQLGTNAALSLAQTVDAAGTRRSPRLVVLLAAAAILVVGAVAWLGLSRPALKVSTTGGRASAQPEHFEVAVTVLPASASVTVDGRSQALREGRLLLSGSPGRSFEVVVTAGERVRRSTVVITQAGRAAPDRVELPDAAPSASATPSALPSPPSAGSVSTPGQQSTAGGTAAPPKANLPKPRDLVKDDW